MKETIETQVKPCVKCGSTNRAKRRPDGRLGDCADCSKARTKRWSDKHRERKRAFDREYRKANPEKIKSYQKKWAENNVEKMRAKKKAWAKANAEKVKAIQKAWQKRNRRKVTAYSNKRRAAKLKATPAWADLKKIEEIYLNCPPGYHIDHYFPLQSPIMCGLHIESNLRYLPAKENLSKGNNVTLEQQLNG